MSTYPYRPVEVNWKRPPINKDVLKRCTQRSDLLGLVYSLGTLAIWTASGTWAYWMYATQQWGWMALALYVHGGLFAFQPQVHEFSHNTVFKTRWLNEFFKRVFGIVQWTSNWARYRMSHVYHHRYTLHRQSEGEEVHPRAETTESVLATAVRVVDFTGLIMAVYDRVYGLFVPHLRNSRRSPWHRYVYEQSSPQDRRSADRWAAIQFLAHVVFDVWAIATGHWFLVVVVSLPQFYGGRWYHTLVHDTMHVGRQPETDDFRACCRSVKLDPITSFLYWKMEYHAEHHAFAGIPCYRLATFHRLTRDHWDRPQTLIEAWREMNQHSRKLLGMETA